MYYLVYGLLYLISLLPLRVLYLLSDFAYLIIYYVAGYRRRVVADNLRTAFPEKTPQQRKQVEKRFYRNFTDNFIETLKMISGGSRFANRHFICDSTLIREQYAKGNRIQFYMGHHFNWELGNVAMSAVSDYPMLMVYLPMKSKIFGRLMHGIRSSSGNHLIPAPHMTKAMLPFRQSKYLLALIADQVPGDVSKAYWLRFFGRPTPFLRGPERSAVAANLSVIFAHIYKISRGRYRIDYELCTEQPASLPKGEITRRYVRYLEEAIRQHPDMWLWSHRRWKRDWKNIYGPLWIDTEPPPAAG